jgi:enoyl-CoA hydratase
VSAVTTGPVLLIERRGPVLVLRVNRPEKRNAVNREVREALAAALDQARADAAARCIVLTGTGEVAFIAGADIGELASRSPIEQRRVMRAARIFDVVGSYPKPLIAAVNGVALGAGLELALACDIRLAAPQARFGQPEVNLGLMPGGGGTQRLPRVVGEGMALKMILTGEQIGAEEALRAGLIQEIVPTTTLLDRAVALGEIIASKSPVAVCAAKQAVRSAQRLPLAQGQALETALFLNVFASEDRVEGMRAFLEKRKAAFTGR